MQFMLMLRETFLISLKKKYGYAETRMATAFGALDDGTLLKNPKHIESVKKFLSLHYVRSSIFYLLMQKEPYHFEKFIEEAKKTHLKEQEEIESNKEFLRHELRKRMVE